MEPSFVPCTKAVQRLFPVKVRWFKFGEHVCYVIWLVLGTRDPVAKKYLHGLIKSVFLRGRTCRAGQAGIVDV